jgi:hypothetical protein
LDAGALQGMRVGSIVALERDGHIVGYGEVVKTGVSSSSVRPVEFNGYPRLGAADLDVVLLASVAKLAVSFTLRVALPPEKDRMASESARIGFAAVDRLVTENRANLPIEWITTSNRDADIYLRIIGDAIFLVPKTGELAVGGRSRTPAVPLASTPESTADDLRSYLWRALRLQNLRRIASEMRDDGGLARAVEVQLSLVRDDAELKRLAVNEKQSCRSWVNSPDVVGKKMIAPEGAGSRLTHCDRVTIDIVNRWPKSVDVTLLYLDSEGGINDAGTARIPANRAHFSQQFNPIQVITWCNAKIWDACRDQPPRDKDYWPIGTERLLIIIAEAEGEARTFQYLAQPGLNRAPAEKSRARNVDRSDAFDALMQDAALSPGKARASFDKAGDATIKIYQWEVIPPGEFHSRR